jgi:hypothetical protein
VRANKDGRRVLVAATGFHWRDTDSDPDPDPDPEPEPGCPNGAWDAAASGSVDAGTGFACGGGLLLSCEALKGRCPPAQGNALGIG